MNSSDVLQLFRDAGALLEGHFRLSSGLHSGAYLQSAIVLQHPRHAEALGRALGERLKSAGATVVLSPLKTTLGKKVVFNLKNIDYINSSGVRVWVLFLRDVRKGREIFYEECSPAVVGQLNIVSSMIEHVEVLSVQIPLQCPSCRTERLDLAVAGSFPLAPERQQGQLEQLRACHECP